MSLSQYFFKYVISGIKCFSWDGLKFEDLIEDKIENVLMMRRETESDDLNDFNELNKVIGVIFNLGNLVFHLFK